MERRRLAVWVGFAVAIAMGAPWWIWPLQLPAELYGVWPAAVWLTLGACLAGLATALSLLFTRAPVWWIALEALVEFLSTQIVAVLVAYYLPQLSSPWQGLLVLAAVGAWAAVSLRAQHRRLQMRGWMLSQTGAPLDQDRRSQRLLWRALAAGPLLSGLLAGALVHFGTQFYVWSAWTAQLVAFCLTLVPTFVSTLWVLSAQEQRPDRAAWAVCLRLVFVFGVFSTQILGSPAIWVGALVGLFLGNWIAQRPQAPKSPR